MNSILFLISFAFASINAVPLPTESLITPAVTKFCTIVSIKKQAAEAYYNQAVKILDQHRNIQLFAPQTVAYLENMNHKNQLLAGGDSCLQYFVALKIAAQNDGQKNHLTDKEIQQRINNFVDKNLDKIVSVLNTLKD